ncbi:MAG: RibD family protein, partial [Phycisphaerales bacterium JB038]
GESKWISGDRARRSVHVLRGRVDAVLTGIGTVRADDPMLNARNVPVRRTAKRIVIDAYLETPLTSKLVTTVDRWPTIIFTTEATARGRERTVKELQSRGVQVRTATAMGSRLDLQDVATQLARDLEVTRVLVETGPGLLGSLAEAGLLDEARVFIAPILMGDGQALPSVHGMQTLRIADCLKFELLNTRHYGNDIMLHYSRNEARPSEAG